ncbi:MAG: hypothetical protein R3F56_20225 [Planctomycetota bacterium]
MKPLPCIVSFLLASAAFAQSPPTRGVFQAIPHLFSVDTGSSPLDLAWKPQGDIPSTVQPIVPVAAANCPDFKRAELFGAYEPYVELDAMSTGNDHIPTPSATGVLDPGQDGWLAFTFSVRHGSMRTNSVMAARAPQVEGDIYGYFVPGASVVVETGVPSAVVDQLFFEQGPEHIGLLPTADIDAHDAYAPYVQAGESAPSALLFRNDAFFFSVTPASAAALNTQFGGFSGVPVHAADVYVVYWDSMQGAWEKPELFRSFAQLGLTSQDDVDALAVRSIASHVLPDVVMFSTRNPDPNLTLLVQIPGTSTSVPPKDRFNQPIRLINSGDIDAVSVYDPEFATYNRRLGWPVSRPELSQPALSLGLHNETGGSTTLVSVAGFRASDAGRLDLWIRVGGQSGTVTLYKGIGVRYPSQTYAWSRSVVLPGLGAGDFDMWAMFWSDTGAHKYSWVTRIRQ